MIIASLYPSPFDVQLTHDMSASIIKDGAIYAYEEEKLTSSKSEMTSKFPERSLMMGCKEFGIVPAEIDEWVFPTPHKPVDLDDQYFFFSEVIKGYTGNRDNFDAWHHQHVHYVDHHMAHASLAVFTSPFEECAFLTKDGGGDLGDTRGFMFGEYKNGIFHILADRLGSQNLSLFHDYLTEALGFAYFENGKTSGLAAYGTLQPDLLKAFQSVLSVTDDGICFEQKRYRRTGVNLDKVYPSEYNRNKIFRQYPADTNIYRMALEYLIPDIAATGEHVVRTMVPELLTHLKERTSLKNIVFSGGLFQNVALNNALLESEIFENIFIPMGPSDSGLSLGAALYIENQLSPEKRKRNQPLTPCLGPSFGTDEIQNLLERFRLNYSEEDDIAKKAAELIAQGEVVGWFQGRAEYGPRSLGCRSILADPRNPSSKSRINQLLKKREWFMPYAPSIQEEYLQEWLKTPYLSPYMQIAFQMIEKNKTLIPAAVHVDGSSRIHVVRRETNPLYWNLIENFRKLTGIPVVLNTSFNRHRIATISTPRQAIEHLLEGCMDYLVIDKFLIRFSENRIVSQKPLTEKTEKVYLAEDSIHRLKHVFADATDTQIANYIERLSALIGISLKANKDRLTIEGSGALLVDEAIAQLIHQVNEHPPSS